MRHPNPARAVAGALVVVAGLGLLAGCGSDSKSGVTTADTKASAAPVPGPVTASTDATAAVEGLPEGFPSADVPLLSEKVLTGSEGGPDGEFAWSVVLQSSRAVSDVSAEVRKDFTGAGYTAAPGNELGDLSVMRFKGPKYDVGVTAARTEGHVVITYVVRNVG
ncbi:hypothetical protein ACVW00_004255 [Marmoricola sp. URHA0025 HA25]